MAKAVMCVSVYCPRGCGFVMRITDDYCECRHPGCGSYGVKYQLPTIELVERLDIRAGVATVNASGE